MSLPQGVGIRQIENKNLVSSILKTIGFGGLLKVSNIRKKVSDEYSPSSLIYRIMVTIYLNKGLKALWEKQNSIADYYKESGKDSYYRMLKNPRYNWRKLLMGVFMRIVKPLSKISERRKQVLILDDTPIAKRGKKIELLSKQYDHSVHRYFNGFTQLYLGWSDGSSFLPIDFCIKIGKEIVSSWNKNLDKRTLGAKRREESRKDKLQLSLDMLKRAYHVGVIADYVVYDTWFAKPFFLQEVLETGYNSVCHLPRNNKIWQFQYKEQTWTFKELYRMLVDSKSFVKMDIGNVKQEAASIIAGHKNGLRLKLVFCKTKHKKDWIVIATTDTAMTDYEVLETYAKRWAIETFFENNKQLLKLGKEQSIDFDVQIAMTTIRAIAYSITVAIKRLNEDERVLGQLFEAISNEFARVNLDKTILTEIFEMVLSCLSLPEQVVWEIKKVFQMISDNFCSGGNMSERQAA